MLISMMFGKYFMSDYGTKYVYTFYMYSIKYVDYIEVWQHTCKYIFQHVAISTKWESFKKVLKNKEPELNYCG